MRRLFAPICFIIEHPLSRGRVLARTGRYLRWQLGARLIPGPVVVPLVDDAVILARPGLTSATGVVYVGLPELESMGFVLHALRPDDLFVDVGANVGVYTLLASAGVGAHVVACEPDAAARDWLMRNIALNGVGERVTVIASAVGATSGHVHMSTGLGTMNHVVPSTNGAGIGAQLVEQRTLDAILAGRQPPSILKFDVEGYEAQVIEGAQATLQHPRVVAVILELIGEGARYGADEAAVAARMTGWGYTRCRYDPMRRALTEVADVACDKGNAIFVRDVPAVAARIAQARTFRVMDHAL